jgi:hypothetical protein
MPALSQVTYDAIKAFLGNPIDFPIGFEKKALSMDKAEQWLVATNGTVQKSYAQQLQNFLLEELYLRYHVARATPASSAFYHAKIKYL